jgi:hypothetical protein
MTTEPDFERYSVLKFSRRDFTQQTEPDTEWTGHDDLTFREAEDLADDLNAGSEGRGVWFEATLMEQ